MIEWLKDLFDEGIGGAIVVGDAILVGVGIFLAWLVMVGVVLGGVAWLIWFAITTWANATGG